MLRSILAMYFLLILDANIAAQGSWFGAKRNVSIGLNYNSAFKHHNKKTLLSQVQPFVAIDFLANRKLALSIQYKFAKFKFDNEKSINGLYGSVNLAPITFNQHHLNFNLKWFKKEHFVFNGMYFLTGLGVSLVQYNQSLMVHFQSQLGLGAKLNFSKKLNFDLGLTIHPISILFPTFILIHKSHIASNIAGFLMNAQWLEFYLAYNIHW